MRAAWEGGGRGSCLRVVGRLERARQRELMGPAAADDEAKSCLPATLLHSDPPDREAPQPPLSPAPGLVGPSSGGSSGETGRDSFLAGSVAILKSQSTSCNQTTAISLCLPLPCHSSPCIPTHLAYATYCFASALYNNTCIAPLTELSVAHLQAHAQRLRGDSLAWTRRDGQTALDKMEEGATLEVIQTEVSL